MKRFRYLAVALATATAALLTGISLPAHAANAVTFSQIVFQGNSGYCATITDSTYPAGSGKGKPGDPIVLGHCAGAISQHFYVYHVAGSWYELASQMVDGANGKGLCVTFGVAAGGPDGGPIVAGDCATAATQQVSAQPAYYGDLAWMTAIKDSGGRYFTLNDKNDVYASGNPLNASFYGSGQPSEDFSGPAPCLTAVNC